MPDLLLKKYIKRRIESTRDTIQLYFEWYGAVFEKDHFDAGVDIEIIIPNLTTKTIEISQRPNVEFQEGSFLGQEDELDLERKNRKKIKGRIIANKESEYVFLPNKSLKERIEKISFYTESDTNKYIEVNKEITKIILNILIQQTPCKEIYDFIFHFRKTYELQEFLKQDKLKNIVTITNTDITEKKQKMKKIAYYKLIYGAKKDGLQVSKLMPVSLKIKEIMDWGNLPITEKGNVSNIIINRLRNEIKNNQITKDTKFVVNTFNNDYADIVFKNKNGKLNVLKNVPTLLLVHFDERGSYGASSYEDLTNEDLKKSLKKMKEMGLPVNIKEEDIENDKISKLIESGKVTEETLQELLSNGKLAEFKNKYYKLLQENKVPSEVIKNFIIYKSKNNEGLNAKEIEFFMIALPELATNENFIHLNFKQIKQTYSDRISQGKNVDNRIKKAIDIHEKATSNIEKNKNNASKVIKIKLSRGIQLDKDEMANLIPLRVLSTFDSYSQFEEALNKATQKDAIINLYNKALNEEKTIVPKQKYFIYMIRYKVNKSKPLDPREIYGLIFNQYLKDLSIEDSTWNKYGESFLKFSANKNNQDDINKKATPEFRNKLEEFKKQHNQKQQEKRTQRRNEIEQIVGKE